jgi:hypothetical protein
VELNLHSLQYRYDEERGERIKTVEIAVDRVVWKATRAGEGPGTARFRIEKAEDLLRRAVLLAGGRWDPATDTWTLPRKTATALGLNAR